MSQSALTGSRSLHVAIIMDGNGRWASQRGRPRTVGHRAGAEAVRRVVEAAPGCGIGTLTLYAFSSDNWKRPRGEVATLMALFRRHLRHEEERLVRNGVRLRIVGRRDRLPLPLRAAMRRAEEATSGGRTLDLQIAIDYSAQETLLRAAEKLRGAAVTRQTLERAIGSAMHLPEATREVDLLIRTGGEQRLSDFLLWEAAYAELYFTAVKWPDFGAEELQLAVAAFHDRERRFGALPEAVAS